MYRSRPGATIKSVAGDLGVNTETLRNWIRAANGCRPGANSSPAAAAAGRRRRRSGGTGRGPEEDP
ncbi:transposase [Streptomyces sp. NPDC003032]